jgi:hypothetical protein
MQLVMANDVDLAFGGECYLRTLWWIQSTQVSSPPWLSSKPFRKKDTDEAQEDLLKCHDDVI